MSHAYPLGRTLDAALSKVAPAARTRADAEALAGKLAVIELATDWLTVSEEAAAAMFAPSEALAHGHLQRYEDDKGNPVVAVTWWKLGEPGAAPKPAAKPAVEEPAAETGDHTDDLYFRRGRTKPSRRRYVDPRQLDLFRRAAEDNDA